MDYVVAFLRSFSIRVAIVMAIGLVLYLTIWPSMSLLFFGIGAAIPAAIYAHRDATE